MVDVTKWTGNLQNIRWNNKTSLLEPRDVDYHNGKIEKGVQTDICNQLKANYLKPSYGLSKGNLSTWKNLTVDERNLMKEQGEMGKIDFGQENKRKQQEREDFHKYAHRILQSIIEQKLEFVATVKPTYKASKVDSKEEEDIKLFTGSLPFKNPKCFDSMKKTESICLDDSSSSENEISLLETIVVTSEDIRKQAEILGKRKMKKNEVLLEGILQSSELSSLR